MKDITIDTIDEHFDSWEGGFAAWTRDEMEQTIDELEDERYGALAAEVAYSVREGIRSQNDQSPSTEKIVPVATEWLKDRREDILAELTDVQLTWWPSGDTSMYDGEELALAVHDRLDAERGWYEDSDETRDAFYLDGLTPEQVRRFADSAHQVWARDESPDGDGDAWYPVQIDRVAK
ncbi:MAG: hypothetical protein U5L04_02390 [Trueperaceae bacterium]|nr:hypothetical protein [Trueperaceae bacterium]